MGIAGMLCGEGDARGFALRIVAMLAGRGAVGPAGGGAVWRAFGKGVVGFVGRWRRGACRDDLVLALRLVGAVVDGGSVGGLMSKEFQEALAVVRRELARMAKDAPEDGDDALSEAAAELVATLRENEAAWKAAGVGGKRMKNSSPYSLVALILRQCSAFAVGTGCQIITDDIDQQCCADHCKGYKVLLNEIFADGGCYISLARIFSRTMPTDVSAVHHRLNMWCSAAKVLALLEKQLKSMDELYGDKMGIVPAQLRIGKDEALIRSLVESVGVLAQLMVGGEPKVCHQSILTFNALLCVLNAVCSGKESWATIAREVVAGAGATKIVLLVLVHLVTMFPHLSDEIFYGTPSDCSSSKTLHEMKMKTISLIFCFLSEMAIARAPRARLDLFETARSSVAITDAILSTGQYYEENGAPPGPFSFRALADGFRLLLSMYGSEDMIFELIEHSGSDIAKFAMTVVGKANRTETEPPSTKSEVEQLALDFITETGHPVGLHTSQSMRREKAFMCASSIDFVKSLFRALSLARSSSIIISILQAFMDMSSHFVYDSNTVLSDTVTPFIVT